ncbi:MAG: CoA transferase [Candidatus Helarchaeota archaeon]|nr:CoA transferase [Candidatus Helarchaeota archaeon]
MKDALEGIRVLDLSQYFSGPWGSQLLADMGAEIIKVEMPGFGETLRLACMIRPEIEPLLTYLNRNKKSITLDIKKPRAREIFKELVKNAEVDVVLENFTPDVMPRLGLGYEELKKINPKLIYAAITGFGQTGPYKGKPAFDIIAQAASGILDVYEIYTYPPRIPFSDLNAGAYVALGILEALRFRDKTGKGQFVDISMHDMMFAYNLRAHVFSYIDKETLEKDRPTYNCFQAKDGSIALVVATERQFRNFCNAMGRPDLLKDRRFKNSKRRRDNSDLLFPIFREWIGSKTVKELLEILEKAHIPAGKIVPYEEAHKHPQIIARQMVVDKFDFPKAEGKPWFPNVFIRLSESPGAFRTKAPELGQHNKEVLSELLGYTAEEISKLKKEGII